MPVDYVYNKITEKKKEEYKITDHIITAVTTIGLITLTITGIVLGINHEKEKK